MSLIWVKKSSLIFCVYVLIFVLSETWTDAYNIPDQSFDYI